MRKDVNDMFEIKGKVTTAICYAKVIEDEAIEQIRRMCDYDLTRGSKVRIMPDVHAGKGCTIGTTMTITDKICPNIVGVDIGCGMYTVKLQDQVIDFEKIDEACHYIPSGMNVWEGRMERFDLTQLKCYRSLKDAKRLEQSVRLLSTSESASDIQKEELFQITKSDIQMLGEGEKKERESGTARKELDEMVGLASVKTVIHKAIAKHKINKLCMEKGLQRDKASLHMVFTGNPGTAKTTVARLFAEIMKDEKILSTGVFVEVGRADLVGEHVGATAPLVKKKFKEAQGGVLFIDEAYSLCDGYDNGFGDEAINTIVQEMENHRDNVIVIFAGYPEPMKAFLDRNPGMRSRIAFSVEFDDYTVEELCEITKLMLSRKQMTITEAGMKKLKKNFESVKDSRDYGNGRFARKMLEEAEMNLAERICQMGETEITTEVLTIIEESDIPDVPLEERRQIKKIGFAC